MLQMDLATLVALSVLLFGWRPPDFFHTLFYLLVVLLMIPGVVMQISEQPHCTGWAWRSQWFLLLAATLALFCRRSFPPRIALRLNTEDRHSRVVVFLLRR